MSLVQFSRWAKVLMRSSALTRPGRFDRHIAVPLPDIRGRVQIIKHHMKGVKIGEGVDPKRLARGTIGFSGADLSNMIK